MGRNLASIVLVALVLALISLGAAPPAVDTCSNLLSNASLKSLPGTTITSSEVVSGTFTPGGNGQEGEENPQAGRPIQGLPSFCRVAVTLKPSPVSDIKLEVWLPTDGWNQKIEGVGNGGLAGSISYAAMAPAIKAGYASVSTDTGHVASDTTWLPVEERERDYGFRAIHGMTVTAKAIVQQFYGSAAKRSYFSGCSTGGGQALGEAEVYPDDYDGILAGAVQDFPTRLRANMLWQYQVMYNEPANVLSKDALTLVSKAEIKECGGQYGSADGFLSEDPRGCHFDPEQLACKSGQDPATCLTGAQITVVKKIHQGNIDTKTKQQFWPGLMPGSEQLSGTNLGWDFGPKPDGRAGPFYALGVFENPDFDFHSMDVEAAAKAGEKKYPFLNHKSTDISSFTSHGKLLMYHGWADPSISTQNSINYYGSLVETVGMKQHLDTAAALKETEKVARLFMVPGMGHCTGGPGPFTFDGVAALDQWVEHGTAPDKIVAAHMSKGTATFSRPLCPYPQEAEYTGTGDRNDASTWVCKDRPFTYDSAFYKAANHSLNY